MSDVCPKGFICINNMNVLNIILLVLVCLYFFNKENNRNLYDKIKLLENQNQDIKKSINNIEEKDVKETKEIEPEIQLYDVDRLAYTDPLYPPLKRNFHISSKYQPSVRGLPINIETRGSGGDFQQIGMLYKESVSDDSNSPGNNNNTHVLPLFGKPTYRGSSKYLYYTASDSNTSIKIPINYKSKDCTDDQGCEEINNGDTISVPSYNGNFKVNIYKFDKPRYIPYVY